MAVVVVAVAGTILAMTAFMAVAMGGMNGCGGMMGGCGGGAQTPAVFTGDRVTIEISDFDFSPRDATVEAGTSVMWVNRDSAPHDATDDGDAWATETLDEGESGSVTFDAGGKYDYHCSIHPYMNGTLTVVD
jgi:plastocyanin